jgi:hypothetical protein
MLSDSTEQNFARLVQQAHHIGIRSNVEISQGDVVSTHQRDFWGNVEEPHTGGAKVRGFCAKNRKLISREVQATELQQEVQKIKWNGAAKVLSLPAIAKIWAHTNRTTGGGGWLEHETMDAAIRWSLLGDTRMRGLAPCPGRNEYFSLETIQALQVLIQSYLEREDLSATPLLQVALEGLTGINGKIWKEVDDSQLINGIELDNPALQQALTTSLELSIGKRRFEPAWVATDTLREDWRQNPNAKTATEECAGQVAEKVRMSLGSSSNG